MVLFPIGTHALNLHDARVADEPTGEAGVTDVGGKIRLSTDAERISNLPVVSCHSYSTLLSGSIASCSLFGFRIPSCHFRPVLDLRVLCTMVAM